MAKHSKLSASSSERWLNCHGSLILDPGVVIKPPGEAAEIGTMIHSVSEDCIMHKCGSSKYIGKNNFNEEHSKLADFYIDYVLSVIGNKGHRLPFVLEKQVDYSKFAVGGFGTADCIVHDKARKIVHIIDLKTGRIEVNSKDNSQLMLYALGARETYNIGDEYDFNLTIVQPRLNKIDSYTISTKELLEFGDYVYKQSEAISLGSKIRVIGDHCKFCPNNPTCPELSNQALNLFDNQDMLEVYNKANAIRDYLDKIEEHFLSRAIAGEEVTGYKLVEGRSIRKWIDNAEAELIKLLGDKAYTKSLITITDAKSLANIEHLTYKPSGKLKLVRILEKGESANTITFDKLD